MPSNVVKVFLSAENKAHNKAQAPEVQWDAILGGSVCGWGRIGEEQRERCLMG